MTLTRDDYTIAWICALPLEMAAAETMLDEIHSPLPQQPTDPNAYIVGRLSSHNIVIACLPSGVYGTTSAATVLSHMLPTFPSLQFGLMVGIGGGVPSNQIDIRLGDVVVSMPTASSGGVVQYDYGKALNGRFQRIGSLNKPPLCLLTAVSRIRSSYIVRDAPIEGIISDTLQKHQRMRQDFSRPDVDWLFSSTYDHQDDKPDCSTCDHDERVDREPRATKAPQIHYGLIASGNQVMKDAQTRDFIARETDILCFEMEAAGLMDQLSCLVIRGISDYCDSHKNKQWQGYAALAAAAYAKDLLAAVPVAFSYKKDLGETENAPATLSEENLECIRSLGFREQEHRFNEIHTARRTCTWLLEDLQYQAWMASSRGLFWIKGNPGTGKSVLMKSAVQSMAHINTRDVVVSFFITGRGTHLQKTPLGLFRALLNGMLEYFPQYLSQLTQLFEDRGKRFGAYEAGRWNWVEKELQDFISRVLAEGTNHRPVLIFVDALDECGTEAARSLLTYFKDLMKNVECEGGQLKICFSSRHYPILGLDTIPAIWVEEGNNKDIQFVIQDLLKEVEPAETRKELEEKVLAKAQGGFQWAVLVCNKVIKEKTYGTKAQKLHRMLKLIPEALDELYSDILSDVQETERHQMLKLFRWVLFAERPLSAQELRDAISIDEDTDCRASLRNHESWSDTLADFELHVKHISRGLVEFQTRDIWEQYEPGGEDSDREAQFIHQSVADFLLNDFLCRGDQKVFNTPVGDGHHQLSRSCIKYLTLDEVLEDAQLPRYKLWSKFQLIPYAVQFLFHHIQKVEQESIPQHDLLSLIQWDNQPKQRKIASLWRASDPDSIHTPLGWPFIGATALHIIVAFGSKSAFDDILQRGATQLDGTDTDGNTPLILAIREGHKSIALALLDRTIEGELQRSETCELGRDDHEGAKHQRYQSVNVDAENKDGDTPLTISAAENVGEVALKLIEAGATLRYPGQSAALVSCAIRSRNVRLLKKLVEKNVNLDGAVYFTLQEFENGDGALEVFLSELLRAGANTSRSQQLDGTFERESEDEYESDGEMRDDHAISVASRRGQTAAVKMLLCHGISATTRNQQGETPLLIAVEETHHDTARVLLEKEPSAVELEDEDGRTALDVALASEQLDMAMCLVKEGRFSTNEGLERALYTSIRDNMLEVVKAILDKDMSTVEVRSGHNQTPLSLAAENGHEAIVMALLEKDANVECRDSFGRIPLHLAAQNGHEAIAMALLEKGANLECTDSSGQTPLSLAAQNGHEAVTNALLKKGANLECTDDSSGTPLFLAAENGHEAVIIALLKKCANMECTDSFGRTPLLLAAWNGHKAATNALLESCANMECTDSFGRTPLLLAAQNGHEAVIIALLEKGANMECTDSFSRTPLSSAAQNGHEAIAMALLEKGANLECIDSSGQTPLSLAAQNGHEAVIIALLEKGANMECTDNTSYTPLSLAAWNGHEAVTNALLEKGANLECTDRFGRSPLHLAAENGREAVAMALLKKGANVECTDSSGQTSLLLAVRNKYSLLPLQLLEKGANPNSKDRFGLTPMFWASTHGQASVIKMLIKKGAELEPTDCIGWRPLSVAAKKGHKDVVKLLLERGASTKAIDRFGQSALLLAERHEHAEIVELLVDYNTKSGFQP